MVKTNVKQIARIRRKHRALQRKFLATTPGTPQDFGKPGKVTKGRPRPSGRVAGLGSGQDKRIRASRARVTAANAAARRLKTKKVSYRAPGGLLKLAVAKRHPNLQSYSKSVAATARAERDGQGLTNAGAVPHSHFDEVEFMKGGERHLRMTGREYLGTLSNEISPATSLDLQAGSRFGLYPVSPGWLGGRLQLMAEQFQQHRALKLRVRYCPIVPATTVGAIVLYYNNDVGIPCVTIGNDEVAHAATHDSFCQTPVWQEGVIDIRPEDALSKYVDEESGDPRFEVQGLIVAEAAAPLTLATGESYGDLFLEYEFDFFTEALDYEIPMRSNTNVTFSTTATVGALTDGYVVIAHDSAPVANYPQFTVSNLPPGVSTTADLDGYVFCGVITNQDVQWSGNASFDTELTPLQPFAPGVGVFLRFNYSGIVNKVVCSISASLAGATADSPTASATSERSVDSFRWQNTNFTGVANLQMNGYIHPLEA